MIGGRGLQSWAEIATVRGCRAPELCSTKSRMSGI